MFGVIVSGRPVLTEAQQITPTQFAFQLPSAPSFNHLVVFLLPGTALPPDTAAAVYVQLPPATDFKFLGAIANEKQSAIFKVDGIDAVSALNGGAGVPVTLGISVEPVAQIQQAMAAKQQQQAAAGVTGTELVRAGGPKNPATTKVLAQRIIANAFNFLASFAGNTANGIEVVPLKSFQDWWTKFEKKIEMDPGFLERGDQS
ncbi:uncharacterized protein K452DRAFT_325657 [Aplosporella prunicola CBS 121167]|uniref:Uncharacterized protein n=1 Tax=Aplosporella prunicola CBS 121167 TaxID=1176127 RepID=A0A6A6BHW8_9PEZI|nr:uncharacterized protein K452DRAFT_325657 [Aplosporella prunicola CBS 121167]KAF2143720.1 hypothetical protein K452DRAFT_325657 [Aplosporella prunicola CBS 121167]